MKKDEIQDDIYQTKSLKYLLLFFAFVVIVFGIFLILKLMMKPEPKTLDDLFEETLERQDDDSFLYNGYSFVRIDDLWYTRVKKPKTAEIFTIPLHFNPREVENVSIAGNLYGFAAWIESMNRVFITFNPERKHLSYVALANSELSANLIQVVGIMPTVACDRFHEGACEDVPLINCTNTDDPVIYLKDEEGAGVFQQDNCLIIEGKNSDLVRAMNRFLYTWYGVMR